MDSIKHKEKNEDLIEVLKEISNEENFTEENFLIYYNKFQQIYCIDFRHDYSEVSRFLFSITSNYDERTMLAALIKSIYDYSAGQDKEEESSTTHSLRKLNDHINLEIIRMIEIERISQQATSASEVAAGAIDEIRNYEEELKDIEEKIKHSQNSIEKIDYKMENSTTESITILSIFAAIVITFTGGLSFISNALSGINKVEPYRLTMFILLIGIVMFNSIFLLLYMLGKIIGKKTCSSYGCAKVQGQCNKRNFSCYIIKYPYIAWFNTASIISILVVYYLSIVDRYNIITRMVNKEYLWIWILAISSLGILILIIMILIKMYRVRCKNNKG